MTLLKFTALYASFADLSGCASTTQKVVESSGFSRSSVKSGVISGSYNPAGWSRAEILRDFARVAPTVTRRNIKRPQTGRLFTTSHHAPDLAAARFAHQYQRASSPLR